MGLVIFLHSEIIVALAFTSSAPNGCNANDRGCQGDLCWFTLEARTAADWSSFEKSSKVATVARIACSTRQVQPGTDWKVHG